MPSPVRPLRSRRVVIATKKEKVCVCVCVRVGSFAGAEDLANAIPNRCVRMRVLLKAWRHPRKCRASVETGRNRHSQGAPRRFGFSVSS
jgi:hypothetical protein